MVLQFQPPPDWLVQNYVAQKNDNPFVDALNSAGSIAQQYQQHKLQQSQLASLEASRKANEFKAIADYVPEAQLPDVAKQYGINFPSAPTPSTGTLPSPDQTAGTPDIQGSPIVQAPSPIVQAHAQTTGFNPLNVPMPTSKAGLAKYKNAIDTQHTELENKKLLEKKGPLKTITKEQVLADGTYDPSTQYIVEPPAPRLDISTKQDQFDQKEWDKIVRDTNPLTARTSTTLGMAAKANFNADRALVTLSKPVVTNQEAGNVMADIASIYQNGSPTAYGMSHQEYSTLYGKIQGALQTVTGKPQDALPDEIKNRLVEVLHDMKGTNNQVLKQQLDFTEKSKARIIKKFPQEWQDIRGTLENNPANPGQTTIPETGPHGASVTQNGQTYNWNPRTGQYE